MRDVRPEILAFAKTPQELIQLNILIRELQISTLERTHDHYGDYYAWGRENKLEKEIEEFNRIKNGC